MSASNPFSPCYTPDQFVLSTNAPDPVGPGPHPVIVVGVDAKVPEGSLSTSVDPASLPKEWTALRSGTVSSNSVDFDFDRTQLLACVTPQPMESPVEVTCPYGTLGIPPIGQDLKPAYHFPFLLYDASFRVVVRAARTGVIRGEFTVPDDPATPAATSDDVNSGFCPKSYAIEPGRVERPLPLIRGIDLAALKTALTPYVEPSAR